MTNDIHAMDPGARDAALAAVEELKQRKIRHKVTSTVRTEDEQMALYFQHRAPLEIVNLQRKHAKMYLLSEKENSYSVTNADGLNNLSNHQTKKAIDIVPLGDNGNPIWPSPDDKRWGIIADVMERHGFRAGLRWNDPDPPHYDYIG